MAIESTLNVSKPWRDEHGNDRITCQIMPWVTNYSAVANAIEHVCADPGAFQEVLHERKSPVWTVVLVSGTRLDDVSEFLADRFGAVLPDNVQAIPESALLSAFEEDDVCADCHGDVLRGLLVSAKKSRADAETALRRVESVRAEADEALGLSRVAFDRVDTVVNELQDLLEAL